MSVLFKGLWNCEFLICKTLRKLKICLNEQKSEFRCTNERILRNAQIHIYEYLFYLKCALKWTWAVSAYWNEFSLRRHHKLMWWWTKLSIKHSSEVTSHSTTKRISRDNIHLDTACIWHKILKYLLNEHKLIRISWLIQ